MAKKFDPYQIWCQQEKANRAMATQHMADAITATDPVSQRVFIWMATEAEKYAETCRVRAEQYAAKN